MADIYLSQPAIHLRLRQLSDLDELRATWERTGHLRLAEVLEPGLAAELRQALGQLPCEPYTPGDEREDGFYWRCEAVVPQIADPQIPEPLFRAARFIDRDLPLLVEALTGRRLRPPRPRQLNACRFPKSAWLDATPADAPSQQVAFVLGLTADRWPREWGGQLELLDGPLPAPAFDTLDLFDARVGWRVPLVLRHVERWALHGQLEPASAGEGGP